MSTIDEYRLRLQRAAVRIGELSTSNDALRKRTTEPIAIIGMGCRFPCGGSSPSAFWRAIEAGVDGIRPRSARRRALMGIAPEEHAGAVGELLEEVDEFDAEFFGISAREAIQLDPQQRLLLEVACEAFERAGQPAAVLKGSKTGVFVGMTRADYLQVLRKSGHAGGYAVTGNALSTAAGRIAYTLGLHGPCMTVDTACSSSLVAVHLACQSLRMGDSDLGLAGGANLMFDAELGSMATELQLFSSTGRCRSFDARADGIVSGEGCGFVVLKRQSDAERDGDHILATIRSAVINQDGRSSGLTAPSVSAQVALLRNALETAGVLPEEIGYVETHGTGTPLGDPIEFEALRQVLGTLRGDGASCFLGALKTNTGHMDAVAGVGGLIKAVLCMQHGIIPKNLHFEALNPHLSLDGTPFVIPTANVLWDRKDKPRRAGVSSFGISGTNAHVILEEAPRFPEQQFHDAANHLLLLSAKKPEALAALAQSYQQWLTQVDAPLHHIAYTASVRRDHHEHRLGVVGATKEEIAAALAAFVAGELPPNIVMGKATRSVPNVVFVFPGQGSQWVGMGRQLRREEPAFRNALIACDDAIRKEANFSVIEELDKPEETSQLDDIDVVQPVLFAIEVALAALWQSWGIIPDAVVGHSMGEVAAAFVAGALSMGDAAAIICRRSRLLRKLSGKGAMALVDLTMRNAEKALVGYENRLSVAVNNGPRSTVISGDPAAVEELLGKLEREGVFCRRVKVDVASHSPQMDPLRDELLAALAGVSPKKASIPMRSTVTGERVRGDELSATYWADNLRKPVLFSRVVEQWITDAHTIFLEMSPHPILTPSVEENLREANVDGIAAASMRRAQDERQTMLSSLGALYVRGVSVTWKRLFPKDGRVVELPTYPWQRERYWVEAMAGRGHRARQQSERGSMHPLLGDSFTISTQPGVTVWENELRVDALPYLQEHRVQGKLALPGAVFLEMAVAALPGPPQFPIVVEDVLLTKPLFVHEEGSTSIQTVFIDRQNGTYSATISSVDALGPEYTQEPSWSAHVEMSVRVDLAKVHTTVESLEAIRARCTREISSEELYGSPENAAISSGSTFQSIQQLFLSDSEAFARIKRPANAESTEYRIHPALLDAVLQVFGAASVSNADDHVRLLASIGRFTLFAPDIQEGWCHARLRLPKNGSNADVEGDVVVMDDAGNTLLSAEAVRVRRSVELPQLKKEENALPLLGSEWQRADDLPEVIAGATRERWLLVACVDSKLARQIESKLISLDHDIVRLDVNQGVGEESGATAEFTERLIRTFAENASFRGAIHLVGADDEGAADMLLGGPLRVQSRAYASALVLARTLASAASRDSARLFLITRGAEMVDPAQSRVCITQAPLSGLARALVLATTNVVCRHIDLDPTPADAGVELLTREFFATHDDDVIALRSEGRYCNRLKLEAFAPSVLGAFAVRGDATYVIVGGPRKPCNFALEWLVDRGAQRVILCHSRDDGDVISSEMEAKLEVGGIDVRRIAMDWNEGDTALAILSDELARVPSLGGVFCALGAAPEGQFLQQSSVTLCDALQRAVSYAVRLHELTKHRPLDMFVFSIPSDSLLGTVDALTGAAAGAFAYSLANHRRSMNLPALVILEHARGESNDTVEESTIRGTLLAQALSSQVIYLGAPFFNGRQWVQQHPHMAGLPRVNGLLRPLKRGSERKPQRNETLMRALTNASAQERTVLVERFVTTEVAHVLRMAASRIDRMVPLRELGLDSLMSLEVRNRFERALGLDLPATLVFTYPTIAALAVHLLDRLNLEISPEMPKITPTRSVVTTDDRPATVDDRIAIIGMACRFPGGASDPNRFWNLLVNGVDAVIKIPSARWRIDSDSAPTFDPVRQSTHWGAFLTEDLAQFDAHFFGISPREAIQLDPQQRLLLEVTWEALEHAGIASETLVDSDTGVFVSVTHNEYGALCSAASTEDDSVYAITGNDTSFAGGRISYTFGCRGPSMMVNTGCSSSLVAAHLACHSLLNGESSVAIVGASKLMLSSETTELMAKSRAMSPDGRCKTFDARANGFVRGEGAGIVVLKRLSEAERDGDRILAVIRATVLNQDGRSTGMTAPNVLSQQALLRRALELSGLSAADIGYVETHGTGTSLGDPIEFEALREVMGTPRADGSICALGALKTNVGHMESAAGIGGIIKAVLCLQHQTIPPNINFKTLNPRMSMEGTPFVMPTESISWKSNGKPRRAGVSSFGASGTNAHLILEEAPRREEKPFQEASSYLLPLSAKTPEALADLARSYQEWFAQNDDVSLHHLAYTVSTHRNHQECRAGVVGSTKEEIAMVLEAFAKGEMLPGIVTGKAMSTSPKVVFVFPGQGSQWVGMGRQLYREQSAFRDALVTCDEAIRKEAGFSIIDELDKPEETSRLSHIDVIQPVLFAIEVALAALWRSWGVEPAAVVGHSMGEVAAAFVAGALSLGDAAAIICRRSRLLRKVSGQGAMALVELTLPDTEKALHGYEDRLSVAVSNGPRSTVIAGDPSALDDVLGKLEREGVFCRRVNVDIASHSPQMDPLLDDLLTALKDVSPKGVSIPMRSTVTSERVRGEELSAAYWVNNLRKPVLFGRVVGQWIDDGYTIFLEMSPHPILTPSVEENLRERNAEGAALASTRRAQDERKTMLSSLAALYARGVPVAWKAFFLDGGRVVELPTYPWQRERYWVDPPTRTASTTTSFVSAHVRGSEHPLLGLPFTSSLHPEARFWQQSLSVAGISWLAEHRVQGEIVFPGAGYVECALAAGVAALGESHLMLEDISLEQMLVFRAEQSREVQVVLTDEGVRKVFNISSQSDNAAWVRNASGYIRLSEKQSSERREAPRAIADRLVNVIDIAAFYQGIRDRQAYHGPSFQGIVELRSGENEAVARIRLPDDVRDEGYILHPALLDACIQASSALFAPSSATDTYVPVGIDRLQLYRRPARELWVVVTKRLEKEAVLCDLRITDELGNVAVEIEGLRAQKLERSGRQMRDPFEKCVYEVTWRLAEPLPETKWPAGGTWVVFADGGGMGDALNKRFAELGQRCIRIVSGPSYEHVARDVIRLDPSKPEDYRRLFKEMFGENDRCHGVVHLASLDVIPFEQTTVGGLTADLAHASVSATYLAQAIVRHGFRDSPRLILVTRGAQSVNANDRVSVSQAPILGLAKSIAMELPELRCTRIDLSAAVSDHDADLLLREFGNTDREDQIAWRGMLRHVPRLMPGALQDTPHVPTVIRMDRTYLITGGLGGLGFSLAQWLVEQGARSLVLVSRKGPSEEAQVAIRAMEEMGARVHNARADVSKTSDVENLFAMIRDEMPPIGGIIHAAMVLDDRGLLDHTEACFQKVFAPKALGAWNLHQYGTGEHLDFFVMYSSAVSLIGTPGQGNYCASNAYLDALCRERTRLGLPGMSIQWGAFSDVGAAAAMVSGGKLRTSRGGGSLSPTEGQEALRRLLAHPRPEVAVTRFDVRQWVEVYPSTAGVPFFAELMKMATVEKGKSRAGQTLELLQAAPLVDRLLLLEQHLMDQVGLILRLDPRRIHRAAPFQSFGVDSLMSLELRNRLEASLGIRLSATILFTYASVADLAQHLFERLWASPSNQAPIPERIVEVAQVAEVNFDTLSDEDLVRMGEDLLA